MGVDYSALAAMYDSAGALQAKQLANQYKLGKDEIAARLKIAAQSSKDTRYGIDAERDAARERVEQARQEMERIGIPDMEIRRFVAETTAEIARAELGLKREIFLAESGLARDQLNQDIREMEEIGIPRVEIERYVAEQNARMAELTYNENQRQFNTTASGYMQQGGQLSAQQQARLGQIQARDQQLKAAGQPGIGAESPESEQEMYQLLDMQAGRIANPATGTGPGSQGQRTLEGEELDRQYQLDVQRFGADEAERRRRYGLDVAQFGAELASTPDTYFQARRFQGVDVPRLMGGAGVQTNGPTGGPTPGIATMGAYLSGQDPYAQAGGVAPGKIDPNDPRLAASGQAFGAPLPSGAMSKMAGEWESAAAVPPAGSPYGGMGVAAGGNPALAQTGIAGAAIGQPNQPDPRLKQVQQVAKASPPSPYDGLDSQDRATLGLMHSIYQKGGQSIAGGEYERLQASGRLGYMQSAGRLLGYDPKELEATYKSYRPQQGDARLA